MTHAALIAHYFPGLGDPFELTVRQFNGALDRLQDLDERENGRNHLAYVGRMEERKAEDW